MAKNAPTGTKSLMAAISLMGIGNPSEKAKNTGRNVPTGITSLMGIGNRMATGNPTSKMEPPPGINPTSRSTTMTRRGLPTKGNLGLMATGNPTGRSAPTATGSRVGIQKALQEEFRRIQRAPQSLFFLQEERRFLRRMNLCRLETVGFLYPLVMRLLFFSFFLLGEVLAYAIAQKPHRHA